MVLIIKVIKIITVNTNTVKCEKCQGAAYRTTCKFSAPYVPLLHTHNCVKETCVLKSGTIIKHN